MMHEIEIELQGDNGAVMFLLVEFSVHGERDIEIEGYRYFGGRREWIPLPKPPWFAFGTEERIIDTCREAYEASKIDDAMEAHDSANDS